MYFAKPWPRVGHTLNGRGADWRTAAYLDAGWGTAYARIEGFRSSAELNFAEMTTSPADRNFLVYPFAANWRHAIELQLKDLLGLLARLHSFSLADDVKYTHNLAKLWSIALPFIEKTFDTETRSSELATGRRWSAS